MESDGAAPSSHAQTDAGDTWNMIAKVCDFGLSMKVDPQQLHVSNMRQGTPFYISPEVRCCCCTALRLVMTHRKGDLLESEVLCTNSYH